MKLRIYEEKPREKEPIGELNLAPNADNIDLMASLAGEDQRYWLLKIRPGKPIERACRVPEKLGFPLDSEGRVLIED